jgi:Catalase
MQFRLLFLQVCYFSCLQCTYLFENYCLRRDLAFATSTGAAIYEPDAVQVIGKPTHLPRSYGPQLIQGRPSNVITYGHVSNRLTPIDIPLLDAFRHFNCERIPERILHAKGAGAHGWFLPTADLSDYTIAHPFQPENLNKKIPVTSRFSTVEGESGSADTTRTFRGFAFKLKTEVGNWDWGRQIVDFRLH